MDDKQKKVMWFVAAMGAVALLLYFYSSKKTPVEEALTPPATADFYAPYYYSSPGNYPAVAPFESTVNMYLDNPALANLSNQYLPLFGLVGMVGVQG